MTFLDRTVSLLFVDELSRYPTVPRCSCVVGSWGFMIWTAMVFWRLRRGSVTVTLGPWGPGLATSEEGFWHQDFLSHWDSMECDTHTQIYIYIYNIYIYIYTYIYIISYIYIYDIIYIYILCNSITFTTTIWHLYIYKYRYQHTQCAAQELVQLNSKAGPQGKWGLEQRATGDLTNRTRP